MVAQNDIFKKKLNSTIIMMQACVSTVGDNQSVEMLMINYCRITLIGGLFLMYHSLEYIIINLIVHSCVPQLSRL